MENCANCVFEKLKILIYDSPLENRDKEQMTSFLAKAPGSFILSVYKLFQKEPEWILKVNENIKLKRQAWFEKNTAVWDKILRSEYRELAKLF